LTSQIEGGRCLRRHKRTALATAAALRGEMGSGVIQQRHSENNSANNAECSR
jgi:hypothetical protein